MHELGITTSIVDMVLEAAKERRVVRVSLEIGKLAGVMPDAIRFCFDVVSKDTPLEGAELRIVEIDGHGRCNDCGVELVVANLFTTCTCGSHELTLLRGRELLIKTVELEEAA